MLRDNVDTDYGDNSFRFNILLSSLYPSVFAACTYSSFLCVCYLHDVKNVLKMYQLSSGEEVKTFPLEVGSIMGFTGRKKDSEIFYYFTSFLAPGGCGLQDFYFLIFCLFLNKLFLSFFFFFPGSHHLPL